MRGDGYWSVAINHSLRRFRRSGRLRGVLPELQILLARNQLAPALARSGRLHFARGGLNHTGSDGLEPDHQRQFARGEERRLIGDGTAWRARLGRTMRLGPVRRLGMQNRRGFIMQNRSGRGRTRVDRAHAQAAATAPAAMIVVSVRGLAVSAFHQNTSFPKKRPVSEQQQSAPKAPLADIRTSMLRFSLGALFRSFRKQTFPSKPQSRGYLPS